MTLSLAGWGFLIGAWLAIGGLTAWCMFRLLRVRAGGAGTAASVQSPPAQGKAL